MVTLYGMGVEVEEDEYEQNIITSTYKGAIMMLIFYILT